MQTETLLEAACSSMPSILHSGQESIVDVVSHFGKTCQVHSVPTKAQTLHKWLASWQDLTTLHPPPNGWGSEGAAVGDAGMLEWAILDAQFHGLAQRRRRVFAIVDFGDWESRQPILLERESLRGTTPPSREARQEITGTATSGTGGSGDTYQNNLIGGFDYENNAHLGDDPTGPLLKGSPTGGGRPLPAIAYSLAGNTIGRKPENGGDGKGFNDSGVSYTLTKTDLHGACYQINTMTGMGRPSDDLKPRMGLGLGDNHAVAYAFEPGIAKREGGDSRFSEEVTSTLRKEMGGNQVAVAFTQNTRDEVRYINGDGAIAGALSASSGMKQTNYVEIHPIPYRTNAAGQAMDQGSITATLNTFTDPCAQILNIKSQVRKLTPIECARLQGFPDDYLDIQFRNKPAADSHKYKALGNSMAVPVMRYIGLRVLAAMETEQ
jgi:DNA (cytosine-5)-methyltransferase 1